MFEDIEVGVPVVDFQMMPPKKLWVVLGDGKVMVTDDLFAQSPEWREETDQKIVDCLRSPEFNAAAERNTNELWFRFGGID